MIHNEALMVLDGLTHLSVKAADMASPPPEPQEGDRYLVATPAGGLFAGHESEVALFQDGAFMFLTPRPGWLCWDEANAILLVHDDSAWRIATVAIGASAPLLGINATADTVNRLAVASAASLFSNAGAGHQLKINKQAEADTASLLFQTGFSGRAEMGVVGEDDFTFKVSADGATFADGVAFPPFTDRSSTRSAASISASTATACTGTGEFVQARRVGDRI